MWPLTPSGLLPFWLVTKIQMSGNLPIRINCLDIKNHSFRKWHNHSNNVSDWFKNCYPIRFDQLADSSQGVKQFQFRSLLSDLQIESLNIKKLSSWSPAILFRNYKMMIIITEIIHFDDFQSYVILKTFDSLLLYITIVHCTIVHWLGLTRRHLLWGKILITSFKIWAQHCLPSWLYYQKLRFLMFICEKMYGMVFVSLFFHTHV